MNNESTVLFMRHAERPPIPENEFGTDLSITDSGKIESIQLGKTLKESLYQIYTSPVQRCFETACAIRKGADNDKLIIKNRFLGNPGIYIHDEIQAGKNWERYGHEIVCKKLFFEKDNPMDGFNNPLLT